MVPKKIKSTNNINVLKVLIKQAEEIYRDSNMPVTLSYDTILNNLVYLTGKRGFYKEDE
jgi:hypothetical protein